MLDAILLLAPPAAAAAGDADAAAPLDEGSLDALRAALVADAALGPALGAAVRRSRYRNMHAILGDALNEDEYLAIVRNQILVDAQAGDVLMQVRAVSARARQLGSGRRGANPWGGENGALARRARLSRAHAPPARRRWTGPTQHSAAEICSRRWSLT